MPYGGKERKKNIHLSLQEKLQVIKLLQSGKSEECVANIVGNVSKSQVHRISQRRDDLLRLSAEGTIRLTAKRMKNAATYPEVDQQVWKWVQEMRNPTDGSQPLSLSRSQIQERARHEAELQGIQDFKASNGWFSCWRRRCDIPNRSRLNEAGDVDDEEGMESRFQELRTKLSTYPARFIFSMAETGLFFRATPDRPIPLEGDDDPLANSLKAKDKITLILCLNATGIFLFSLLFFYIRLLFIDSCL